MFQLEQVPTSLYRVMNKAQLPAGATSGQGNKPWLVMAVDLPRLSSTIMPVMAGGHGTCQGAWREPMWYGLLLHLPIVVCLQNLSIPLISPVNSIVALSPMRLRHVEQGKSRERWPRSSGGGGATGKRGKVCLGRVNGLFGIRLRGFAPLVLED
nr:hypothetical protein [Tanacetum cinerariifolium]